MKIIHTADLHIDSKMESNLSKEQAIKRRGEILSSFEGMVDYASDNGVEIILICGDMFDKLNVRKTATRAVLDIITSHPDIKFLYLRGNHDCDAFDAELMEVNPGNIFLFTGDSWTSYEFGDVVITGREINDENHTSLYSDLVLNVSKLNIVMLHGQEAMYDGPDKTHVINIKSLRGKYIDYLALGHIHSYKKDRLDERGVYCYSGCLEPRGFDECGTKGFVLLETTEEGISSEFIPFQKRTFIEKEIEITPDMDMTAVYSLIEEETKDISPEDLVKLVITGFTDMDRDIDCPRIWDRFSDRFFFLKVYDRTRPKIDYESFAYDRTLKGSFVRLVMGLDIPEEDKGEIVETGIRAIMGEEIS